MLWFHNKRRFGVQLYWSAIWKQVHLHSTAKTLNRFLLPPRDGAWLSSRSAPPGVSFQRVMMQIVQELCKRPGLNRTSFDMPTIYIPNPAGKPSRCANQIEEVCKDVEKTINQTIQNTLNSLEKDCRQIVELIDEKVTKDRSVWWVSFTFSLYLFVICTVETCFVVSSGLWPPHK